MAKLLKIRKRKHFGTDGIRGSISKETNPEFILKLGWAAGKVFKEQGIKALIIGKDTRISGYMLETALQSGVISAGQKILKYLGLMRPLGTHINLFVIPIVIGILNFVKVL